VPTYPCTKCALHLGATTVKVPSRGSDRPLVLFVGEAPAPEDDLRGEPFRDKPGRILDKLMRLAGLDPAVCRWTNAVRCIPRPEDGTSSYRRPYEEEIETCMPYLEAEILTKNPVFVVPLGNTALHALLPKAPKIGTARKKRWVLELPSLKWRYRKAKHWLRQGGFDDEVVLKSTTDSGYKSYLRQAENLGFPTIPTRQFTVYPSYAPSAASRGNLYAENAIIEDLGYLRSQVTEDRGIPFESYEYSGALEEIRAAYERIKEEYRAGKIEWITLDFETNGLNPYIAPYKGWTPKALLFSIAYGKGKSLTVPFQHRESSFANDYLAQKALVAMTQDLLETVPVANHNIKFDLHWAAFIGIAISKIRMHGDTMLASWTIWNDTIVEHNLETLATRHVGMVSHKEEMTTALADKVGEVFDADGGAREPTMDDIAIELVHKYCCADVDSTWRLHEKFRRLMDQAHLLPAHDGVCVPAIVPTADMEIAGIRCDLELLRKTRIEYEQTLQSYYDKLNSWGYKPLILGVLNEVRAQTYRKKGKNPPKRPITEYKLSSTRTRARLVFDILGFEPIKVGADGPSTDKAVMSALMEECTAKIGGSEDRDKSWTHKLEVLELVAEFVRTSTIYTRYIKPIPQFVDPNGIVHPAFGIRTTRTGRYTCRRPSFHQMPWKSVVKSAFQPHHSNGLILSVDYSQMELRVLASVAGDPDMIAAFESGEDIHRLISSMVLGKPQEMVLDAERRRMKTVVFGLIYGRTARSIAAQEHISEKEAQSLIDKFFARFPKVAKWIRVQHAYAKKHGCIWTPMGFRRVLEAGLPEGKRNNRAVNTPVQGGASDVGLRGLVNTWKLMKARPHLRTTMFAQVHDSILFSVRPNELFDIMVLASKGMVLLPTRELSWLKAPLKIDFELGTNWGELVSAELLPGRKVRLVKAKPEYHDELAARFLEWECQPDMVEFEENLTLEDGSKVVATGQAHATREAVKEITYTSVWEFPAWRPQELPMVA
jgi:uracil-DNA glycosylase family 4